MANIAVALANDFEDSEFSVPCRHLTDAGHTLTIFGKHRGETVSGKHHEVRVTVETTAHTLYPDDYAALLIPGGNSPDQLRTDEDVVSFVRGFFETGKPVAAICHGPQLLIEAGVVKGRILTSWPSVRKDLLNAGAIWIDEEVVEDGNLITSRKPDDLPAFSDALLRRL